DDFRASLLLHDGQEPGDGDDDAFEWLPGHGRLACLDAVVAEWKQECATYEEFHSAEAPQEIDGATCTTSSGTPGASPSPATPGGTRTTRTSTSFPDRTGFRARWSCSARAASARCMARACARRWSSTSARSSPGSGSSATGSASPVPSASPGGRPTPARSSGG